MTSNLRKAHVTRDSSGPATLAISVSLQQSDINPFWKSTYIWSLRTEDSLNLEDWNFDS